MKKLATLLLFMGMALISAAQMEVLPSSFVKIDGFVNNNQDIQYDDNDKPYAVIRMKSEGFNDQQIKELQFAGNAVTFFEIDYVDNDVLIYISYYATFIKISHPDFGTTEFWFPYQMLGGCGYEMKLVANMQASGYGSLAIATLPENGATIVLKGEVLSQKTPYKNVMIPTGHYDIVIRKAGFKTIEETVYIMEGENKDLTFEMPKATTSITLVADDDTKIYVDDDFIKKGTWKGCLDKGNHKIEYRKDYYKPVMEIIEVVENTAQSYNLKNEPIYSSLSIVTNPEGANVSIDDVNFGVTPLTIDNILIGPHTLTLAKSGSRTVQQDINLEENKPLIINKEMDANLEGALPGVFSLSPTRKVHFSKGNMQYQTTTKTWRFAEHQWDYIGIDKQGSNDGWMDLFAWGTSGYNHMIDYDYVPDGYSTSSKLLAYMDKEADLGDHSGKADWGYNAISNGGGSTNIWHTPLAEEWNYLLKERKTPSKMLYALACVNNVNGLIIFPDDWNKKNYKINKVNNGGILVGFDANVISSSTWEEIFEPNGAVFMPAAGGINSYDWPQKFAKKVDGVFYMQGGRGIFSETDLYDRGLYWSASSNSAKRAKLAQGQTIDNSVAWIRGFGAKNLVFWSGKATKSSKFSVRTVCDVDVYNGQTPQSNDYSTPDGYIDIQVMPTVVDVKLNGELVGQTPMSLYNLEDGVYDIELTCDGYQPYSAKVEIKNESKEMITAIMEPLVPATHKTTSGVFTIDGYGHKIRFAPGNLQYQASTNTWRFAENQWDYIGKDNEKVSVTSDAWIDMFGWGTGNNPTNTSTVNGDYSIFTDWGQNNIQNSGFGWFTLTGEQWEYILYNRITPSRMLYSTAMVNNVSGLIIFPDDWDASIYDLQNINYSYTQYGSDNIPLTVWLEKFEANGAVFLPSAGYRGKDNKFIYSVFNPQTKKHYPLGSYWGATRAGVDGADAIYFVDIIQIPANLLLEYGHSVRLVCPAR